jgi:hypothetical protein
MVGGRSIRSLCVSSRRGFGETGVCPLMTTNHRRGRLSRPFLEPRGRSLLVVEALPHEQRHVASRVLRLAFRPTGGAQAPHPTLVTQSRVGGREREDHDTRGRSGSGAGKCCSSWEWAGGLTRPDAPSWISKLLILTEGMLAPAHGLSHSRGPHYATAALHERDLSLRGPRAVRFVLPGPSSRLPSHKMPNRHCLSVSAVGGDAVVVHPRGKRLATSSESVGPV